MAARHKMDAVEMAFQLEQCGFEVIDNEGPGLVAFCAGISVRAEMVEFGAPATWRLTASTGAVARFSDIDLLTDWVMDLRHPPAAVAFHDGEVVLRLEMAAA